MFGLGQQYTVYFSFPKSVFISLPKKKTQVCVSALFTYI